MLLGDVIARFDDETVALETLLSLGDLPLLMRARAEAAERALTVGEFASEAVRLFADEASDEDWTSLIGVMGRTEEPGRACLRRMVEFALAARGGAHDCGHHQS